MLFILYMTWSIIGSYFHMKAWSCFLMAREKNICPIHLMVLVQSPITFSVLHCWYCLFRTVHMLQMWSSVYFNLDLGTLVWCPLGWGCLISKFWIGSCLNKLSRLVPRIESLFLWIYCKVWSKIQISLAPWFSIWIYLCLWFAHLWHIGADAKLFKFIFSMVIGNDDISFFLFGFHLL